MRRRAVAWLARNAPITVYTAAIVTICLLLEILRALGTTR